jgi:RNA polymerase sigma-70 factor, ECF subfamily
MMMQRYTPNEVEHLASARSGNMEAFSALTEPYRKPLLVHGYRLSGSLDDAEDLVQDTFLRVWNNLGSYEGRGSFQNWLYVIATRLWLDEARKRKKRVLLPLDGDPADPDAPPQPPAVLSAWLDPLPDSWLTASDPSPEFAYERRETISYAFMTTLQKLNARQRVVLILREVFTWSAKDVASALGFSVDSVNNLLYRARKNLKSVPYTETQVPEQVLDQFVDAWESGDVDGLIALLHEKATFAMPPMGLWYSGQASIRRVLQNFVFLPGADRKLLPARANGFSAYGMYQSSQDSSSYEAAGLILPIFSMEDERIRPLTAFLSPQLVKRFGLPLAIPR